MKKVFKITIILIIILTTLGQTNYIYAALDSKAPEAGYTDTGSKSSKTDDEKKEEPTKSIWSSGYIEDFDPSKSSSSKIDDAITEKAKIIVTIIRSIGIVISVIILMVLGIKQMISSVEEKSIIKQSMPAYIIGAILVFAITWLPTIIYDIMQGK